MFFGKESVGGYRVKGTLQGYKYATRERERETVKDMATDSKPVRKGH